MSSPTNKITCFLQIFFLCILLSSVGCKKKTAKEAERETGTVTDIQGNVYSTVKIGDQWWMTENLKVKQYNDGTLIRELNLNPDSNKVWAKTTSGAFCVIDSRYGLYYNWFAVNDIKKIAPDGWHVPSDEEWKIMEREVGMSPEETDRTGWRGGNERETEKLLNDASVGWPNALRAVAYGTNESGFSALPGGCRLFDGTLGDVTIAGYWWSSAEQDSTTAWYRNITNTNKAVFRYMADKNYGLNIRCIKN